MTALFPPFHAMPAPAPLAMPPQDLRRAPASAALAPSPPARWARAFVFGVATFVTAALGLAMWDWFNRGGTGVIEAAIIALGVFTAFWIALSVAIATLGLMPRTRTAPAPGQPLDIALLVPVYGEPAADVAANIRATLASVAAAGGPHRHTLYILSDTRDPRAVRSERRTFAALTAGGPVPVYYRHRALNDRFKAGNIAEWVSGWGGGHDAMLVLDADSRMSGAAIGMLADRMAGDPRLGLVQSVPRLYGAQSIFARMQQFANAVYGTNMARGLAMMSGDAANYWGHNALIRTRAFAEAAGLPDLPGRRPFGGVILSHDFVEAALLRRAGWRVAFEPDAAGSYERTPEALPAHIMRDRRWCQGNLQHLRVIGAAGLHPLSRMHMLHGAMAYVASVGWFALMVLWVVVGTGQADGAWRYFSETNPLFPAWPEMDLVSKVLILTLIYGMLIAPKVLGALRYWAGDPRLAGVGGPGRFVVSWLFEAAVSVLLAPVLMVQHMIAVGRTFAGRDTGWRPSGAGHPTPGQALRFHIAEVGLGAAMTGLYFAGVLSLWLLPIGLCLLLAPLLSLWVSTAPGWAQSIFTTPQERDALVSLPEAGAPDDLDAGDAAATALA